MKRNKKPFSISIKIPTKRQVSENPGRMRFVAGGWVDGSDICNINLYWHKRQHHFTIYSLLQVLEHETLHAVLADIADLETSKKLDNINRCSCVWLEDNRPVFVNEYRITKWVYPPYFEEPTEDLLG